MCPVSAGVALATSLSLTAGTTAFAVAATVGAAATGAAIGVGVGGIVNVATGRGFFEGAGQNALFGAIAGGFSGAVYNVGALAPVTSQTFATAAKLSQYAPGFGSIALTSAASSLLAPPQLPTFSTPVQTQGVAQLQQYSSQQLSVTGSGGGQAAASLAEAIKRSKSRKLTQRDVGDLSIDTASFAGTGLQFA